MTEPSKNALGLVGFPTPNTAAGEDAYLLFLFPDPLWAQYILGACRALVYERNWYEAAEMTPQEAADAFEAIIQQAPYNLINPDVPAPYWDDAEDSDDEAPPDTQIWYGDIVSGSFVENVENWAIAGFIAAAGQPAAAVYFLTIAPRFRLAWKTGDIGGIVRVFIDAEDYGTVDTSAPEPGLVTMDIIPTTEADTHTVLLVKEGA
jgi:hypothetical protein